MKVAHLTSAHPRYDTRIFLKQCRSLAAYGYQTYLVVADGKGDEVKDNVHIVDSGICQGRFERMHAGTRRVLAKAWDIDASLYHIHDPELIPAGLLLRARGKKIVFDSHEDVPKQILSKPYLPTHLRKAISISVGIFERKALKYFNHVVAATPHIRSKFIAAGIPCVDVNNYPIPSEFSASVQGGDREVNQVAYVGGMTTARGIIEAVEAIALLNGDARLCLGGPFQETGLRERLRIKAGWEYVDELGYLNRQDVAKLLTSSTVGLVTLHPTSAYVDSLPVKMFEYMSAGLPVIASNFPLWRSIIEGCECGICVDPKNPNEIASAITRILKEPERAREMGARGQAAVAERFNWLIEAYKLISLYKSL